MMRIYAAMVLAMMFSVSGSTEESAKVIVRATGQAPAELPNAREMAVEAALRQAVESGVGIKISSMTQIVNFQLLEDAIYTETAGIVETYKVLAENPNQDGLYTVRVEATVSKGDINTKLQAWKALIKRKGQPRIMVVGSVDKQPFEKRLTAEIQGTLERKELTVIDLDMLSENQRLDAERAAKGDLDPMKAALIMREKVADYFVVVQVEGTKRPPQEYYGATLYGIDATAILKVVTVDTARILASEVENASQKAQTPEEALRLVTTEVTQAALKEALKRIAAHWLSDVDQRGGTQIEIIANGFSFERINAIIAGLRASGGCKDIIVDQSDAQGSSHIRVITNTTAFNIAAVLSSIDPSIKIASSSKYQVEISPGSGKAVLSKAALAAIAGGLISVIIVAIAIGRLSRKN